MIFLFYSFKNWMFFWASGYISRLLLEKQFFAQMNAIRAHNAERLDFQMLADVDLTKRGPERKYTGQCCDRKVKDL